MQMDGADVVFICNGIVLSHKKEWNLATCNNMEGSKSDKDKYDKYDFTYMYNLKGRTN